MFYVWLASVVALATVRIVRVVATVFSFRPFSLFVPDIVVVRVGAEAFVTGVRNIG